ncbi:hypothetical protein LTR56_019859 [Elasticomyces elasticus]|nr:hypothetical protein LTR22_023223 [Elasticomyces elasticus]KAK3626384.1 hypothetical protein LTR56_019859 [Elasticomyces elasticus]KAK4907342.1 hypothetical protein LTR49_023626 [Elasticomyces elasticus]KAK5748387.1 hypothetical protein LTS12_021559 [Elasticomyces elasticus]
MVAQLSPQLQYSTPTPASTPLSEVFANAPLHSPRITEQGAAGKKQDKSTQSRDYPTQAGFAERERVIDEEHTTRVTEERTVDPNPATKADITALIWDTMTKTASTTV